MKVRLQCEGCETVYVVEDDRPDAEEAFARFLAREGCDACGGHTFTPVCSGDDADCECGKHWSDEYGANRLYLQYLTEFFIWCDPIEGAVTPDLSEFFRFCDDTLPPIVHWARWLRIPHHLNDGTVVVDPDWAEALLEAYIAQHGTNQVLTRLMRRAFHEGFGTRDPDQLELFPAEEGTRCPG